MSIKNKLEKNVQPQLESGETLQAVFPAQGGINPWFVIFTGYLLFMWMAKYVIVAVTDKRIVVFKASPLATTKPKEVLGTYPRDTRFGPLSGIFGKIELGGTKYYVHKRFHKEVAAADAASAASEPAAASSAPVGQG
jgi:hypothetical protein